MTPYVLDASAILRFLDEEAGHDTVIRIFREVRDGKAEALVSAVSWGEVIYILAKRAGLAKDKLFGIKDLLNDLRRVPLSIVPANDELAERAGLLRAQFSIPYADCFSAALAGTRKAVLVAADFDFKTLPASVVKVEYLPAKG